MGKRTEIVKLLGELKNDPMNVELMNSIAIGYFENYDQKTDKEDYDFFELAYKTKKTVKTAHNFAWFLYFEWSEMEWRRNEDSAINRAIRIQEECINLKPNSFYPYYQYGLMLLEQKQYESAIGFLKIANYKQKRSDILQNLGYCYFLLKDFENARHYFNEATKEYDLENKYLFSLAITEYALNNLDRTKEIADELYNSIEPNQSKAIDGHEIGFLYFLISDFEKSAICAIKQGLEIIDLVEWPELSFSVNQQNNKLWTKQVKKGIKKRTIWLDEILSGHDDWKGHTLERKYEETEKLNAEIEFRQNLLKYGIDKPNPNLEKQIPMEHCGCLLFGCKTHKNSVND
jgi:tetratricopeptide (TPR) repeat protein